MLLLSHSSEVADRAFGDAAEPNVQLTTRRAIFLKDVGHYVENHRQQIVYLFIFFSITILLFAERFYSKQPLFVVSVN